ncbi:hypothetical protein ECDEC1B_2489 [Escherichia coli DEC1B]|nr:hypothetical protein ECDEC1B_2489 [Escherichia coli DEC1B]
MGVTGKAPDANNLRPASSLRIVFHRLACAICFNGGNSGFTRLRGGIHLAGADNLMIGGFQIEIEFAIACRFFS